MLRGIGKDGRVIAEGLESDHWVALDIGKKNLELFLTVSVTNWQRKAVFGKKDKYLFVSVSKCVFDSQRGRGVGCSCYQQGTSCSYFAAKKP